LSARHPSLAHGAGLMMVAEVYYSHLAKCGACDKALIRMAKALGNENASEPMDFVKGVLALIEACDVTDLKMSDYGVCKDDLLSYVTLGRYTLPHMFAADPVDISDEEWTELLKDAYK